MSSKFPASVQTAEPPACRHDKAAGGSNWLTPELVWRSARARMLWTAARYARVKYISSPNKRLFLAVKTSLPHYDSMQERTLTIPEIGLIAGTRVALGVGIGLLISNRLNKDQRKAAGLALLAVGVLTTVPIVLHVVGKRPAAVKPVALVS